MLYLRASVWSDTLFDTQVPLLSSCSVCATVTPGYQASQVLLQAIISASPDIGSVLITMNTNDGDRDSVHCEGGPLHKLQPSGSPTSVLDSMDLEMDFQYSGNEVVVPQVCSLVCFMVFRSCRLHL